VDPSQRFRRARDGSTAALGELFESCRNYLLLVANLAVKKGLQPKTGASDLVQEAFSEAHRIFDRFQGETEEELRRWLLSILDHKIGNVQKSFFGTARRDVSREQRLNWGDESGRVEQLRVAAAGESPSGILISRENQDALQQALEMLPDDHQTVIRLRVEQDLPFAEIGQRMDRSEAAVQQLYLRAVMSLKRLIATKHAPRPHSA
jgi:RNA polymerase sigma-70 factor, ECF subfamily